MLSIGDIPLRPEREPIEATECTESPREIQCDPSVRVSQSKDFITKQPWPPTVAAFPENKIGGVYQSWRRATLRSSASGDSQSRRAHKGFARVPAWQVLRREPVRSAAYYHHCVGWPQ